MTAVVETARPSPWAAIDHCYEAGWTDGLPVVPPAEALVDAYLDELGWDPDEVALTEPVRSREITLRKVVANGVMAGCLPAYLPVVRAALEALGEPQFNLHGPVTSTGGATPLLIVNGPVRDAIGMNYRDNLFGPGNRANATIGRAIRLIFLNCLSARPGVLDRSTQGSFGKYTGCFAEHEAASPWEPLSVARGVPEGVSAVTVFAAESPHNILCHGTTVPEQILAIAADTMAALGSFSPGQSVVVLAPEHTRFIAAAGWSRRDVQTFLFDHARRRLADLKRAGKVEAAGAITDADEHEWVHRGSGPDDILVLVGGGDAGGHSAFFPSWSRSRSSEAVTRAIT
ncbi:MAG TPA: hypothetical protein VFP61_15870 [Acidimicrobiales bacterium]|nr:hypothetical protein [Acidimicrobiales bacterium]